MSDKQMFRLILLGQLFLLVILGWHFREALNPDAVAYLRIAGYFAEGRFDLAISGYWGPLLSGLMALGQMLGLDSLEAARVVMGISAALFLWGTNQAYAALRLPARWRLGGLALAALASAWWSVQFITPDLLLSAMLLFATNRMLREDWTRSLRGALFAGVFWGLAYLVKAIALPLGFVAIALHCGRLVWERQATVRAVSRSGGITAMVMIVIASPWIATLSAKYGRLTFSTTPPITHTLTGPPDMDRYHPFAREFHQPEAGRVTSWEEPSRMVYHRWSPWESVGYATHQAKVIGKNFGTLAVLWTSINLAAVGLLGVWLVELCKARGRSRFSEVLWLPVSLAAIYLPCYFTFTEQRFFYVALPFFFVGVVRWLNPEAVNVSRSRVCLVWAAAVLPMLAQIVLVQDRTAMAGRVAAQLAERMRVTQHVGLLAGSANLPGGRTGLYVAFLLNHPWHGDMLAPQPPEIAASGAKYFVVRRETQLAAQLGADARFVNLDASLFESPGGESNFPVQVFQILTPNN